MEKQMIKYFKENIEWKNKDQMYNVNKKIQKGDKSDLVTQLLYMLYDKSTTNEGVLHEDHMNTINNKNLELDGENINLKVKIDRLKILTSDYENKIDELKERLYQYQIDNEETYKQIARRERDKNKELSNEFLDFKEQFNQYERDVIELKRRERSDSEKDQEIKELKQEIKLQNEYYAERLNINKDQLMEEYKSN
jgi:DNA-binding transcriptional regulator YiaG